MLRRGGRNRQAKKPAADGPKDEEGRDRILATALKALAARPRSEMQLRGLLLARTGDPDAVDNCIAKLKELGFIDDRLFAFSYASSRLKAKPVGRSRLARELIAKKVAPEAVEETLEAIFNQAPEGALLDRAIEKWVRTHGRPVDRRSAKRMFDHLARLGFEYDSIIKKLRAMKANLEE